MMGANVLLKGGVVIVHEANDHATGVKADLLIVGGRIAQIGPDLALSPDAKVIDCTDKIVAPGFIDTHRHMYNTALRGRHGDNVLVDYLVQGILQGGSFQPRDIFWGQLAGCMESINAGTTTVVDHSHLNYAEQHPKVAINATAASGIRSVYGFCFTGRVDSWSPFALNPDFIAPFALDTLQKLANSGPHGDGRIDLGVAFDGWFLPPDTIKELFQEVKRLGINTITTHYSPSPPGVPTMMETMQACGILSPESTVIVSHANNLSPKDVSLVKSHGVYLSSTPSVELQMGLGGPCCFDPALGVQSRSSLGLDCHNVVLASLVSEMRAALLHSRATYHDKFLTANKMAAKMNHTTQEAYALGTIQGARAVGLEKEIGSLAVGKKADIVIFDALSPSMVCGAQHDPVTAIVMHSTPGDICMTFVGGILRKSDGKLLPVNITGEDAALVEIVHTDISWSEVSKKLLESREVLQVRLEKLDLEGAKIAACDAFGMDSSRITAKL